MVSDEVLQERERIKDLIKDRIAKQIAYRKQNIKKKDEQNISLLEYLERHLLFLIDNPDYKRTTGNKEGF